MLKHGWLPLQYVMYETIACGSARWSPTKTWKKTATFTLDNERSTDRGKVARLTEIIFPKNLLLKAGTGASTAYTSRVYFFYHKKCVIFRGEKSKFSLWQVSDEMIDATVIHEPW